MPGPSRQATERIAISGTDRSAAPAPSPRNSAFDYHSHRPLSTGGSPPFHACHRPDCLPAVRPPGRAVLPVICRCTAPRPWTVRCYGHFGDGTAPMPGDFVFVSHVNEDREAATAMVAALE